MNKEIKNELVEFNYEFTKENLQENKELFDEKVKEYYTAKGMIEAAEKEIKEKTKTALAELKDFNKKLDEVKKDIALAISQEIKVIKKIGTIEQEVMLPGKKLVNNVSLTTTEKFTYSEKDVPDNIEINGVVFELFKTVTTRTLDKMLIKKLIKEGNKIDGVKTTKTFGIKKV